MAGVTNAQHARGEYRSLMHQYAEALSSGDPSAKDLLDRAEAAWHRLRSFGDFESQGDAEMHVALAFIFAVSAGDAVEVKRLYDTMSPEYQRKTDMADAHTYLSPGFMKLWLRRSKPPPPVSDLALEQRDPARARAAVAYEYWRFETEQGAESAAASFHSLGVACEGLGRVAEAVAAYENALRLARSDGDEELCTVLGQRLRNLADP